MNGADGGTTTDERPSGRAAPNPARIDWSRAAVDGGHIDAKEGSRHGPVAGQPRQAR
jgi:hypothetical protein